MFLPFIPKGNMLIFHFGKVELKAKNLHLI